MILTPLEIDSISKSLDWWERAEYIFALLVTVACAGEYIADFTNWLTAGLEERKRKLAKRSTLLLISALALELLCLVRTNQLSGRISRAERGISSILAEREGFEPSIQVLARIT